MKTLIIAEAGVNHNGSLKRALDMVEVAAKMGADVIKFQTFIPEQLVTQTAPMANYQQKNVSEEASQYAMLKKLSLSFEDFRQIKLRCSQVGIEFISTPFDLQSADFLYSLGMTCWKIPSGEITNLPYLRKIASFGGRIIMSTGMCTLEEVKSAVAVMQDATPNISLLHCTTEYPAPFESVNLRAMLNLAQTFGYPVGYSDHTSGIEAAVAAVTLGATIIEKHFTLDKMLPGPDHKASLNPIEFQAMVQAIRNTEKMLGTGEKKPAPAELGNKMVARKSIVASIPIRAGELFTEDNLTAKRPGTGISPMLWDSLLGKTAKYSYAKDEQIYENELE